MEASNDFREIDFGGPAAYRIVVQGVVSSDFRDRLAGLSITTLGRGQSTPHTVLTGLIHDQAQLSGVLDALYGLHLPIVSVEEIEPEDQDRDEE